MTKTTTFTSDLIVLLEKNGQLTPNGKWKVDRHTMSLVRKEVKRVKIDGYYSIYFKGMQLVGS